MFPLLLIVIFVVVPEAFAEDSMYQCEDGTFTNRSELHCPPYEPHGVVLLLPEGVGLGTTKAQVDQIVAGFVPSPPLVSSVSTASPAPEIPLSSTERCALYKEWMDLNLQTGGGVTFQYTQNIPRWLGKPLSHPHSGPL